MQPITVMALFCEDIREEKDDVVSLIGVIPDNVKENPPSPAGSQPVPGGILLAKCMFVYSE